MTMLQIAADDTQRLIDLSALLVRAGEGPSFEGVDWSTTLPLRIAEAIDPAARAMAVLDRVIRGRVTTEASGGESMTRNALSTDILPGEDPAPDYLRLALAALHDPVLAPRASSSRATAAPAAALLERLATSNAVLWDSVVPLLFAHAGAEDEERVGRIAPHVVSRARLADAAGIIPGRNDELADSAATIDSEQVFLEWLLRHWTSFPSAALLDGHGRYLFGGNASRFFLRGGKVERDVQRTGVVDFMQIPQAEVARRIAIPISLADLEALPADIVFTLGVPNAVAPTPSFVFKLALASASSELSAAGAVPAVETKPFTGGRLTIGIKVAEALTVDVKYEDKAGWSLTLDKSSDGTPLDITAVTRSGRIGLLVEPTKKIQVAIDGNGVATDALRGANGSPGQGQALRAALALAHAGPAIAGLMGGWVPTAGKTADPAVAKKKSLRERLIGTLGEYVPETFDAAFKAASQIPLREAEAAMLAAEQRFGNASGADKKPAEEEFKRLKKAFEALRATNPILLELFEELRDAAKADAQRLAKELVPEDETRTAAHITQDALPLAFVVDQLQDFDESVDLWARLAGLGVLIGRQGGPSDSADEWWSLNVATLHVSRVAQKTHERQPLGKDNAVPVKDLGGWPSDWIKSARVDPVPLVVSEISGVRSAVIRYESQSIVAEIQHRSQLDARGRAQPVARRPEAYLFPIDPEFPKLPPLTFGRRYDVVPYLIAHGGVKPLAFRSAIGDPTSPFTPTGKPSGSVKIPRASIIAPGGQDVIRSKTYLRTVPIAAPRMSPDSIWPGLFEGVAPLAAELPVRPPPITLHRQIATSFFLDKEHTRGTLNAPPDVLDNTKMVVETSGIRIEIGAIDLTAGAAALLVTATALDPAVSASELLTVELGLNEIAAAAGTNVAGLRIDVIGSSVEVSALKSRAHQFAEDEPEAVAFTPAKTPWVKEPVSKWQSLALALDAKAADFDVEPPSIRWGALRPNVEDGVVGTPANTFQLHGDRPLFPLEYVAQNRDIAVLDGIGRAKGRVGPQTARIKVRRPSTPLATYDRWINGPLSGYGSADPMKIREALNDAAKRATGRQERGSDRSLDDPAVEALMLEVVRLFPQRIVDQPLVTLQTISGVEAILGTGKQGADIATISVELTDREPLNGKAEWSTGTLKLAKGCVYELRLYGAVPLAQPLFAPESTPQPVATLDRFAPAAAAGWREAELGGKRWHLGAPLVLTVEVASEIMPELYVAEADPLKEDKQSQMAFSMNLLRPPKATRERAAVRLEPDYIKLPPGMAVPTGDENKLKYAALRQVDRMALFEQRWSWRGRPHPDIEVGNGDKFGEDSAIGESAKFVDMAFLGRSDDDIGTIHEMRMTRAHAYGGRAYFEAAKPKKAPVLLERELDYRGGANLWRFALRAKSRYAAMRPNDPQLIRFSHRRGDVPDTLWWPFVVPDRANPGPDNRKPMRPGLMLVVPLTEPLMTTGSVPPLLALFNEPMFPLFHAGDGIESVIEVARHPFIGAARIGTNTGEHKDFTAEFRDKWDAVEKARGKVAAAQGALNALLDLEADPTPADVAKAEAALTDAQGELAIAEEAYQKLHAVAVAWGFVDHLEDVQEQVEAALKKAKDALPAETDPARQAALQREIDRLEDRKKEVEREIDAAKKEATALEAKPVAAGDAKNTGSPFVKYWPEFAPDPIRTGAGASGEPLALRCDGPVGYTFDVEIEAGRFDHAGLLVSPVADRMRPWSLVKLRFRRLEAPELLVGSDGKLIVQDVTLPSAVDTSKEFRLSSAVADPQDFPHTLHEGLVFDTDELRPDQPVALRFSFDASEQSSGDGNPDFVLVKAAIDFKDPLRPCVRVNASTKLGSTEQWSASFDTGSKVQLRVVVSQRPKPEGNQLYRPTGDVSVRVRILRGSAADTLQRAHENAWLSIICMPLNARDKIAQDADVVLRVRSDGAPATVEVRPVRLSDFTPGVWCQFAAAMSRVRVQAEIKTATGSRRIDQALPVARLTAGKASGGRNLSLGIADLRRGETVSKIGLSAEGAPDAEAQVEERLYALVTRYVYDAFDRVRERPIAVHKLADGLSGPLLGPATWPRETSAAPYADGSGRVRIVRVLRGRKRSDGGFEPAVKEFPRDFFGSEADSPIADEPLDAAGQVMGISAPFEWSS